MKNNPIYKSILDKYKNHSGSLFPQTITLYHNKFSQLLESSFLFRYIFTFVITVIMVLLKYLFLHPFETPYLLVFSAVIVSSLYAGLAAGLFSTLLTAILVNYLFFPPQYEIKINNWTILHTVLYVSEGVIISFLVETERTLRKKIYAQAQHFQVTLASIGDAVVLTDVKGNVTFMNKVAEYLTGWANNDAIGIKLESVFNIINEKTGKKAQNPVKKAILKNKIVGLENHTVLVKKNGNQITIDDSAAPICDPGGHLIGAVLIFRDITQRRQLEQRKDDFVSIVSHELKTPITSVKLFIQLLKRKSVKKGEGEYSAILDKVDHELNKLAKLISDFLDLSRLQVGKLSYKRESVSLDGLIKDTIADLQQIYNTHDIVLDGSINKKLYADRDRIKQVLINLISNAVKYSKNGHKNKIIVELTKDKDWATVKVKDFGMGIPKDEQNKIFDRFYQVNTKKSKTYPGLGLGLYISSQIIKGHQGKIWVKSEVNKGSVFQFSIPFDKNNRRLNFD